MLRVWSALCVASVVSGNPDIGYDELYVTHNSTVPVTCSTASLPSSLVGTFILPSLGQFEMVEEFQGLLDGYGKLSRFTMSNGELCFASRIMDTGFYNYSVSRGSVAPSMLFQETTPPRNFSGLRNMNGANDNVFVNTYTLGDPADPNYFRCTTDSQKLVEFNPDTLAMHVETSWNDHIDTGIALGSAHPLPEVLLSTAPSQQCVINVHPQVGFLGNTHDVSVYRVCADSPYTRVVLASVSNLAYLPYFHSWGLTENRAVLPLMKFALDMNSVIGGKTISEAFLSEDDANPDTSILVVPLSEAAPATCTLPNQHLFFTHTVNTYESKAADGSVTVVMDVVAYDRNPFLHASLYMYRDKTTRDTMFGGKTGQRGVPTRVTMTLSPSGVCVGTVGGAMPGFGSDEVMGESSTDFTKINPKFHGKKYCVFYADQWHSVPGGSYATMAIVKYNVCTGESVYWRGPSDNFYPSEPSFVPTEGGTAEDDGVLIFSVLNGETRTSNFLVVDARSMQTVHNATLPDTIGFTTHGQFYSGLLATAPVTV